MKSCKEYDYLPYHYSWDRHCGGSAWEFMSRSLGLLGSGTLTVAGAGLMAGGGPVGMAFGASLIFKSGNDSYEALTGKRSFARDVAGDPLYDAIDAGLFVFGFFRKVPKINYLGNPKRDFFTKDPLTYESAFKQFSTIELIHEGANLTAATVNNHKKYSDLLMLEEAWNEHLITIELSDD